MIDYEAAATMLRSLRDGEMAVGRGPKPMGEDYEWVEKIIAAFAGDRVLYAQCNKAISMPPHTHGCKAIRAIRVWPEVRHDRS